MDFPEFNLKAICEGLPDWAHWLVWIVVIAYHFWMKNQVKKRTIKRILGDEDPTKEK